MRVGGQLEIIIDADLPKRLRPELVGRGYTATTLAELGLHRIYDEPMLEQLTEVRDVAQIVLVTGDDRMPQTHAAKIAELSVTVATVDANYISTDRHPSWDEWRRDSVHRWAHVMVEQEQGGIWRHTPTRRRPWAIRP